MKRLQIEYKKVEELIPYINNPRKNDEAANYLAGVIERFGFRVPILIDSKDEIIAGHTRLKAAIKLGMDEVPVIMSDDLSDDEIKAFRLVDNAAAEKAEWDFDLLRDELKLIDMDMIQFGFDEGITLIDSDVEEDDFDEELPSEPKAQRGDIYLLGNHRLMCGDSTSFEDVERLMDGAQADLLLTDPPYNVAYEGGTDEALTILNDDMSDSAFRQFLRDVFSTADSVLKPGGAFYIWHADSEGYNFRGACRDVGWTVKQCLIWNKNIFVMGRQDYHWKHEPYLYGWKDGAAHYFIDDRTLSTIIEDENELKKMTKSELLDYILKMQEVTATTIINELKPQRNGIHPTMKPLKLFERMVRNSSRRGEVVLDLFCGGGTTLMVCEQLKRKCCTMELDPRYVEATIQRWESYTGKKALKIN